jgi:hypothetical protein
MPFVLAYFQVSAAPRLENPNLDKKDALFGLDTQITIKEIQRIYVLLTLLNDKYVLSNGR